ncbi:SIS domain-containing protein [Spirosoma sp. 209]|uniref:SIS domain-containing protein n=1 Tax=Spirosoma sp. 209 TaxID=1955701 RepID=UPI00098D2F03|nr:hypothetical protein [Spirosoma sp. 209]
MNPVLAEILEIPDRAREGLRSPVDPLPLHVPYLGMGSSYFAPLAFSYLGLPIFPQLASEYVYYLARDERAPMAVLLSQSGQSSEVLWCRDLFDQYVAVSNNPASDLCTAPNVARVVAIGAGLEQYSSSKTYVNTLVALFRGFGLLPDAAVRQLTERFGQYHEQGQQLAERVLALRQQHPLHGMYVTGSGPNIGTAHEAALILSESTKLSFQGLPMAQYDHGPKETATNSLLIQILAKGATYDRTRRLSERVERAGAQVLTVEAPDDVAEPFSILHTIVPFNFMAYYMAQGMNIGETFVVGGKVTEAI